MTDPQLGTGVPRSEFDQTPVASASANDSHGVDGEQTSDREEAGIVATSGTGSHPARPDDIQPNRSGSGGTGGPSEPGVSPLEEGSTGESMEQLLGGRDQLLDEEPEPAPRG